MISVSCVLLTFLVLMGALWVVALRNLLRAALSLGLVLLGVAGVFLLLEAEFLAFVQILIYVGAILTLVVFAIMLTARLPGTGQGLGGTDAGTGRQRLPAAIASLGLFGILLGATQSLIWPATPTAEAVPLAALAQQLVTTLVLPFEVISLVFVAALVGAIALATVRR